MKCIYKAERRHRPYKSSNSCLLYTSPLKRFVPFHILGITAIIGHIVIFLNIMPYKIRNFNGAVIIQVIACAMCIRDSSVSGLSRYGFYVSGEAVSGTAVSGLGVSGCLGWGFS